MGPDEYRGQPLPSLQAGTVAQAQPATLQATGGELNIILERLQRLHQHITESRTNLQDTLDRLGVGHPPSDSQPKSASAPPQQPGTLQAIDAFLGLVFEAAADLRYHVMRAQQL